MQWCWEQPATDRRYGAAECWWERADRFQPRTKSPRLAHRGATRIRSECRPSFLLADTDVSQVSVRLLAQVLSGGCLRGALSQELVGERRAGIGVGVVERMRRGVQVVLVFDQQVDGQPRPGSLELIVQNQVGVEEV